MTATATVLQGNGATVSWTTSTHIRFQTKDQNAPADTTYPIPIPTSGTKYSYWKSLKLKFTGSYTEITNVKIYTDGGGFGTGITVKIGDQMLEDASYVQASGTEGDTGDELVATHTNITSSTDFFTYDSSSPKSVDAGPISGDPAYTKHLCLQMEVISTASSGELTDETFTWQYDEV